MFCFPDSTVNALICFGAFSGLLVSCSVEFMSSFSSVSPSDSTLSCISACTCFSEVSGLVLVCAVMLIGIADCCFDVCECCESSCKACGDVKDSIELDDSPCEALRRNVLIGITFGDRLSIERGSLLPPAVASE